MGMNTSRLPPTANSPRPLSDAELQTLEAQLEALDPNESMAVEELDGFLAGLACCPEPIAREEWLPAVLGASVAAQSAARGEGDVTTLLRLIERHATAVRAMLEQGEGFAPVLSYDEDGLPSAHAWSIGFVRAMALRPDAWDALEDDEELSEALDPLMRWVQDAQRDVAESGDAEVSEPIQDDERESLIHAMLDGIMDVYAFFAPARQQALTPATIRRAGPEVGRNDRCACGSGRKFKHCCGAPTIH